MGFKDEMQAHDEQFEEDKAKPRGGGTMLPDGKHQVQVVEFRLEQNEDGWTVVAKFQNDAGSVRKWYDLGHEVSRSILAGDVAMMGYEGVLSDLDEWILAEEPIGVIAEIGIKTKPGTEGRDFTNVYLNRVLGKTELQDFAEPVAAGTSTDDDIPF